ncbi:MAG: hypothetical protein JNN15_08730, partial [Blastocatellia bacterium]|nr:hypothetical protein [Blastocatellia bacterium]
KPLEKRAWAVAAGAIGTLFLGFAYFYFTGIWQDFYNWCFDFNTKANSSIKSTLGWVRAITIIRKSYPEEWFWFLLFVPGFFWYLVDIYKLIREMKTRLFLTSCWRLAPTVAFFAYGVFTFFNLQSGPDVIFFLPFVSMYAAYLFYNVLQLLDNVAATWPKKVLTLSISILLILKVVDAFFYNPKFTLQNEEAQWSSVVSQIGSGDRVYAQGSLDLLVLYNLPNASKYIYFDRGKDRYAAVVEGSFEKIIKDLTDKKPKFVALAKLERVEQRDSLMAWVKNFYQPFSEVSSTNSGINDSVFEYTVYKLKE